MNNWEQPDICQLEIKVHKTAEIYELNQKLSILKEAL